MKIFLAGSTGAVGLPLTRQLLAANHDVTAMTRSQSRALRLHECGAKPVIGNILDKDTVQLLLKASRPDVVIHQATNLPRRINPRNINWEFRRTNQIRAEGTRILWEASVEAGVKKFIAQSVAFAYAPEGDGPCTEECPLYQKPPAAFAKVMDAVRELESITLDRPELPGTVLRYGFFYGPRTAYAPQGWFAKDVRRRRVPLVGRGEGTFSFIHVDDAAAAVAAVLEHDAVGVFNIVDDEPAPASQWLPHYAQALDAPPPRRAPRWLGRLFGGPFTTYLMCQLRGASNAKAKQSLGWSLKHPRWRQGFGEMISAPPADNDWPNSQLPTL